MFLNQKDFEKFGNFLETHDEFIIAGHKEPDGDCLSSCLAMAAIIKKYNKPYTLVSVGPFKRTEIKKFSRYFTDMLPNFSKEKKIGFMMLDCSEYHRLGDIQEQLKKYDLFIVDHHQTADISIENSIIYPQAPATAFLVQLLYEHFCGKVDKKTAETLLLGICTDTGFFRFIDNTGKDLFLAVSRLLESGASPKETYRQINSGKPYSTRKLLGKLLDRAETKFNNKLIYTYETLEDTNSWGKNGRDSDSLYQLLLSVDKVEAALFLRQDTPYTCTAGFRSQENIDVSKIAAKFGGGGHKCASGLSTTGTIDELLPKILQEFEKAFNNK